LASTNSVRGFLAPSAEAWGTKAVEGGGIRLPGEAGRFSGMILFKIHHTKHNINNELKFTVYYHIIQNPNWIGLLAQHKLFA
jgi:hypothetical protein